MVFGRRKKARGQSDAIVDAPPRQPEPKPIDPADREHARLLQCWRRSEQRVLRTWHAWQAAAARDKPERYRAYLRALADEERAGRVGRAGHPAARRTRWRQRLGGARQALTVGMSPE
jgi:hypothetical protein